MENKLIPRTLFSGITLTTLLLIGLMLMMFFFVSVRNKEYKLNERGFRILNQYVINMNSRFSNYKKIAENEAKKKNYEIGAVDIDSIIGGGLDDKAEKLIEIELSNNSTENKKVKMELSPEQWTNNLFDDELFNDYVIIKDNSVLFNTFSYKFTVNNFKAFAKRALIENNKKKGYFANKADSLINSGRYFESGFVANISIAQIDYKLFVFPIIPSPDNNNWYLGGLIKTQDFNKAKRSIESWLLIFIFLFFTAAIVSLPIVRLFLLNTIERLRSIQLYYAGAAIILGFAIINIILLNRLTTQYLRDQSKSRVERLNDTISNSFINEIHQVYNTLKSFDEDERIIKSKNNFLIDSTFSYFSESSIKHTNNIYTAYPYFKVAFWMDSTGMQKLNISTWKTESNLIMLKHRKYFQKPDEWLLPYTKLSDSKTFRIESIYSNTSGDALVALSTKSSKNEIEGIQDLKKPLVAAITSQMYSVIDPILPQGFEYRIIDSDGLVWFHWNKNKNLQENIFDESDNNRDLTAAVTSRSKHQFSLSLYNKNYYAYISPINNLPLYLVTLEDKNANFHQNGQITLAILSYLFTIFFAGIVFVLLLSLFNANRSSLHFRPFVLKWLLPFKAYYRHYSNLAFLNYVQIAILLVYILFIQIGSTFSLRTVIFISIGLFVFNILLPYSILHILGKEHFKNEKKKKGFALIKNKIRYVLTVKRSLPLKISILTIIAISIIIDIKFDNNFTYIGLGFTFILLSLISNYDTIERINLIIRKKILKLDEDREKTNYQKSFRRFMQSWLIIVSFLIPTGLYKSVFIETSHLKLKHQQVYIANKYQERNRIIDNYYESKILNNAPLINSIKESKKEKGNFCSIYMNTQINQQEYASVDTIVPNWITTFFHFIDLALGNQKDVQPELNNNKAADEFWDWYILSTNEKGKSKFKKNLQFHYKTSSSYAGTNTFKDCYIESNLPLISPVYVSQESLRSKKEYRNPNRILLYYLICVVIVLLLSGLLIKKLIKKLFLSLDSNNEPIENFKNTIEKYQGSEYDLFLVNLLDLDILNRKIRNDQTIKLIQYSKYSTSGELSESIKHFVTFLPSDTKELKEHLSYISEIKQTYNIPIITISSYTPNQLIKKYQNPSSDEEIETFSELLVDLRHAFTNTLTVFIDEWTKEGRGILKGIKNEKLQKELQHSSFLTKLYEQKIIQKHQKFGDKQIIDIQNIAQNYYCSIWNMCTSEEKFILYDLASDSITNTKNNDEIKSLIGKRLINSDTNLQVMNKSFANFIVEHSKLDKLNFMEYDAKRKGGWAKFRIPLIIIGLAIAVFVITTQQGLASNIYAILISLGGVITMTSRFSSLFGKSSST